MKYRFVYLRHCRAKVRKYANFVLYLFSYYSFTIIKQPNNE
ncbi:hypothetical protein HMPREF1981_03138 [Bacteroides pyogenes F0041]|uniref:Uncharacterized protein n=1 Tax=Bacteroides pyogenes F0041 TaxID=1321819 RepID=U2CBW4_9BACE|nr:hypothetical protein HMPREF1981_03138 [Bacteroides pyogenes F0041]